MSFFAKIKDCDRDNIKSRTDIPRYGKVMNCNYIKFIYSRSDSYDHVQDYLYCIARRIVKDVPYDKSLKASILDFIADATPENMMEKIFEKLSSENGMMEVLHNERYLIIKKELYAALATKIGDTINDSESLPHDYYIDAGAPDVSNEDIIIFGAFETKKMKDFTTHIDEMQMDAAWNLIRLAGADSHTLTQDMVQNLYGKGSTLFLSSAMNILAGEFSEESSVLGFKDGYVQTFPNREILDDISKRPENYIAIDLLVK